MDSKGAQGSLFSFATIYPEVVERHQVYACFKAAPQSHMITATGIHCACPPSIVRFGGGYRLGRLLGDGTEKRSLCPLPCVIVFFQDK
jgi:hypothetical protein